MKPLSVAIAATVVTLAACSGSDDQQTQTGDQSPLKQEAKEWVDQTKELGSAAMDSAKEAAEKAGEKTKGYYEAAKENTKAAYADVKEKSKDYYEAAKEKRTEMLESGKADMEARLGHPPTLNEGDQGETGAAMLDAGKAELEAAQDLSPATGQ